MSIRLLKFTTMDGSKVAINPNHVLNLLRIEKGNSYKSEWADKSYTTINMLNNLEFAIDMELEQVIERLIGVK